MKKLIALALLSAVIAAPVSAEEAPAKASAKKPVAAHKHDSKKAADDECDSKHDMGGHGGMMGGHGGGMMEGHGGGMMGGHGGMMGGGDTRMLMELDTHLLGALALTDEQQAKITRLSDELKHNNWAAQGLINDETAKLRDLYQADKRDPAAISKEYQKIFDLKRQMIEAYLETENRVEEILTAEQRAQMKEARSKMRRMYGHHMQ